MARNITTGLDVGDYGIKIAVVESKGVKYFPKILAMVKTPSRGLTKGYIDDLEEAENSIAEAIKEAEAKAGQRIRRVYLGVGGISLEACALDGSIPTQRPDSTISDSDIERADSIAEEKINDLDNRRILDMVHLGHRVDGKEIFGYPAGYKGTKLETKTLFVTDLNHHIEDLTDACGKAGISIENFIPSPVATSAVTLTLEDKKSGCVLADIGSDTTQICVFDNGNLISIEVVPVGSNNVTKDISLYFRIPLDEAERIKIGSDINVDKKKLDKIIEDRLTDIFVLIENHLEKVGKSRLLPGGVILCGGGALIKGIDELAKKLLQLPARVAKPLLPQNITLSKNDIGIQKISVQDPSFAVAYGLAIMGTNPLMKGELGPKTPPRHPGRKAFGWLRQFLP